MATTVHKFGIKKTMGLGDGLLCELPCGCSVLIRQRRRTLLHPDGDSRPHVVWIAEKCRPRPNPKNKDHIIDAMGYTAGTLHPLDHSDFVSMIEESISG